jgi:hypothetical protein
MHFQLFAFVAGLILSSGPAWAQLKEIQINPVIQHAALPDGVGLNKRCGFDEGVVKSLVDNTKRSFKINDKENADFQGRKMVLYTTNSTETGSASHKNPKWISLAGELREGGVVVGSFEFRQELTYASLQDCDALNDMAYSLGKSLSWWLAEPARILTRVGAIMEVKKDSLDEEVRTKCAADKAIPKYLVENNAGQVSTSDLTSTTTSHLLLLTIEDSRVLGGGLYTGAKWMDISGKLMDGDKLIGSFKGSRWTMGSLRLCSTLEYLTSYLGGDIGNWLNAPAMNSTLGEKK